MARQWFNVAVGVIVIGLTGCSVADEGADEGQSRTEAATLTGIGPRPASVPSDFALTPYGYIHPSCIVQLSEGESVHQGGFIENARGARRAIPSCSRPRYRRDGRAILPDGTYADAVESHASEGSRAAASEGRALAAVPGPAENGWQSQVMHSGGAYSFISARWTVPSDPAIPGSTDFYFPGLQQSSGANSAIMQPVLAWRDNHWQLESWNCCVNGTATTSTPVPTAAGHPIYGEVSSSGCDSRTGHCSSWAVKTQDLWGQSTVLPTQQYGGPYDWVFANVLETYDVRHCAQLPSNGVIDNTNIVVKDMYGNPVSLPYELKFASSTCAYSGAWWSDRAILRWRTTTQSKASLSPECGVERPYHGLNVGDDIWSCNRRFRLSMQHDGNLVLYDGNSALWSSNTPSSNGFSAVMQNDGNFVLYDMEGRALWSTGTNGHSGSRLAVQDDGNMVIYDIGNAPLWASGTVRRAL